MCAEHAKEQVQKKYTRLPTTAPWLWRSGRCRKGINLPETRAATDRKKDEANSQGSLIAREGCSGPTRLKRTSTPKRSKEHVSTKDVKYGACPMALDTCT